MANGSVAIDTVPLPERTIRITVPASVAFNLGKMQKVTALVLDRFNCPDCHSGLDIRYDIARHIHVDEELNLHDVAGAGGLGGR